MRLFMLVILLNTVLRPSPDPPIFIPGPSARMSRQPEQTLETPGWRRFHVNQGLLYPAAVVILTLNGW